MPAEGEQIAKHFSNQALFSDHYLAERMDAHLEWTEDIGAAFAQLQGRYQAKREILDCLNEAQTEEEFIRPALEMLGFAYIPQTGFTHAGRQLRPDYALFADEAAKTQAYHFLRDEGKFYPRALAICDAKYWGRPLDVKLEADPRDEFKNTNPSFQIVNYLVGTDVDWGILTNGRLWRLYYQKARSRASTYYEVDLGLILEREDREAFRYFYHFFRQEALVKDPATDRNFLERVYEGSATYALQVQEELKSLIFERIVPILAEGFVAWRRTERGIAEETKDSLHEIFTATLTLLYRLLFLLYAESRELLPVSDRLGYYRYSLTRLKREAMARLRREEVFSTVSDDLWNDLAALFRIIDRGDPALNVPTYNGGLFDRRSPRNAFLEEHRIADAYLVQVLDLLTRRDDPDAGERRFIDYKDLDVRHLGSIYEGLLEFYLRIAQEDLAAVKERRVEVYKPLSEVKESRRLGVVRKGELYLENDKGQRKATGSYYTPDYIVKYIVANTLGPIMDEREAAFAKAMTEWQTHWGKLARAEEKLQECAGKPGRRQTYWTNRRSEYRLVLHSVEEEALKALLDVKVCDPAMGSGHFLVEAVAYLTDHIIDILNQYPENPVLEKLATIREQILANLEEQGIRVNRELLTDTNLLKRMVMKRCIYGVDLNPMAVELAKLSLWLDSFTVGAPLSFLDHHLKVGNSLIGARVQEVRSELEKTAEGQYDMFGGPFAGLLTATELMRGVGLRTDVTFDEVQQSAELYAGFEQAILPYKRVLDLWVSKHFDNKRADELLRLYGTEALQAVMSEGEGMAPEHQQAIKAARQLWEEKRFFHWDLEFPEVFIDLERSDWKQNPGFEAVVGNPPYGSILDDATKGWARQQYQSSGTTLDAFAMFLERATQLITTAGAVGEIVPSGWLTAREHFPLRTVLLSQTRPKTIVHMPYDVFPDAYIDTIVWVGEKSETGRPSEPFEVLVKRFGHREKVEMMPQQLKDYQVVDGSGWFSDPQMLIITDTGLGQWLGQWARLSHFVPAGEFLSVSRGITPFVEPKSGETRSTALGFFGSVGRYTLEAKNFALVVYDPSLMEYKPIIFFTGPRLIIRRIISRQHRIHATLVTEDFVINKSYLPAIATTGEYTLAYVLAILNSKLLSRCFVARSEIAKRDDFPQLDIATVREFPIRRIEFTTLEEERRELVEDVVERYLAYLEHGEDVMILAFVAARLEAEPEEADVVHDLLAYLAEQMLEMHKEKQAEAKGFLDWLADYTGLPIDDWKLKTYVRAYWEHPWSEMQRALSQNRRRMGRDVEGREAQARIKREFESSIAKLTPLMAHIEATDQLIDQIVYRLYGLTEEEIAVVERRD